MIWHYRRSHHKNLENEKINIKEIVGPASKTELPFLMAMTKQSMLFTFPLVVVGDDVSEDRVPFIGKPDEESFQNTP